MNYYVFPPQHQIIWFTETITTRPYAICLEAIWYPVSNSFNAPSLSRWKSRKERVLTWRSNLASITPLIIDVILWSPPPSSINLGRLHRQPNSIVPDMIHGPRRVTVISTHCRWQRSYNRPVSHLANNAHLVSAPLRIHIQHLNSDHYTHHNRACKCIYSSRTIRPPYSSPTSNPIGSFQLKPPTIQYNCQ